MIVTQVWKPSIRHPHESTSHPCILSSSVFAGLSEKGRKWSEEDLELAFTLLQH